VKNVLKIRHYYLETFKIKFSRPDAKSGVMENPTGGECYLFMEPGKFSSS